MKLKVKWNWFCGRGSFCLFEWGGEGKGQTNEGLRGGGGRGAREWGEGGGCGGIYKLVLEVVVQKRETKVEECGGVRSEDAEGW